MTYGTNLRQATEDRDAQEAVQNYAILAMLTGQAPQQQFKPQALNMK
jgi:hypothetical protein